MKHRGMLTLMLAGILCAICFNCDNGNPAGPNTIPSDTTKNKEWANFSIVYNSLVQVGNTNNYKVIIDKPALVDSINTYIIDFDTTIFTKKTTAEISDTVSWEEGPGNDGQEKELVRFYEKAGIKDTVIVTNWIDTIPVNVVSGTFYQQTLKTGDTLSLYVKTESQYTDYTCQWYKNGQKVGDSFIKSGNDSISYVKTNVSIADSGTYSISLDKPHAAHTESGMIIRISN
jgi:hypothetical protein